MNCPKCTGEMITAQATNFGESYQYCRNCKMELKELLADTKTEELSPGEIYRTQARTILEVLVKLGSGIYTVPEGSRVVTSTTNGGVTIKHMFDPMTKRCLCGSNTMMLLPGEPTCIDSGVRVR